MKSKPNVPDFKHVCSEENAPRFKDWIENRGGVAVWKSINLSNIGASWSTPALAKDGTPTPKPTWEAEETPSLVVTDPKDIGVTTDKEVKRFHVAVRRGGNGFMLKCTEASTRKIDKALTKAGEGSHYQFDYSTQEAVIFAVTSTS